jgi:hypothetical protein
VKNSSDPSLAVEHIPVVLPGVARWSRGGEALAALADSTSHLFFAVAVCEIIDRGTQTRARQPAAAGHAVSGPYAHRREDHMPDRDDAALRDVHWNMYLDHREQTAEGSAKQAA